MFALLAGMALQDLPVRLKLEQIEAPYVFPFAAIVAGVQRRPLTVLGLFINNEQRIWDDAGKAPVNWEDTRVGTYSFRVSPAVYKADECLMLDVLGTRTQVIPKGPDELQMRHQSRHLFWVTEKGKLLAERFTLTTPAGEWFFEAEYGAETFSVTIRDPIQGKRELKDVSPGFTMTDLTKAPFRPMVELPRTLLAKEKSFLVYNPWRGGAVKMSARAFDPFDGRLFGKTWKGQRIDLEGLPEKVRIFYSEEGYLMRVQLAGYRYLQVADDPSKG
jgi:hypothetical protein